MPKPRIQRSTKNLIEDTVLGNLVDFERIRRITSVIYGRPMTGKTLLVIYEAARLAKLYGGGVLIYTSEPNYVVSETFDSIKGILSAFNVKYEIKTEDFAEKIAMDLYKRRQEVKYDRDSYLDENGTLDGWVPEYRVVVLDSLGSLADSEEDHLSYYMRRSARTRSSAVIPAIKRVVRNMSRYAAEAYGWAFAISHAASTAGTGLYEGLVEYKPSFTEKALHYCSALVWLASAKDFPDNIKSKVIKMGKRLKDVKMAVLVMYRSGGVGKGIVFEFKKVKENGVEYPKPTPLFAVMYQHDEEELI